jgi:pyruvate dehydrogenase E1 component alpha subunit
MENSKIYKKVFYKVIRIRLAEEEIIELYPSELFQSPVHLSIERKAVAVFAKSA